MKQAKKTLIAGVGNTLRSDDGVGHYIGHCIEKMRIENVNSLFTQQLDTNLLEEFIKYDTVIVADAAVVGKAVSFIDAASLKDQPVSSSHHVNVGSLSSLAKQLYQKQIAIMLCTVRVENFDMGEQLSAKAKHNADDAINTIVNWIKSNN